MYRFLWYANKMTQSSAWLGNRKWLEKNYFLCRVFQNARCRCLEKAGTVAASSSLLLTFWFVHLEILPQRAVQVLLIIIIIIIIINHPSSSSNTLIQLFKDFPRPAQNLEWKPSYLGKDLGHLLRFFRCDSFWGQSADGHLHGFPAEGRTEETDDLGE